MAEIITGDGNKDIKSIGELALRISKFDSYRLFTLYENVNEGKLMDVSGNQKYYLVFKSPKKEIRIPEYDPNGDFEVDKVNGCILFKITKKNAEDILSMKTSGDKIFHIIRVFEERDAFGKVLSVTDEVEVYNGKWGDDEAFSAFSTENMVQQLLAQIAILNSKNASSLKDYNDLFEKYTLEVKKVGELETEMNKVRAERDALQTTLDEINANTYDGTLLSTDTKYIAFENTLDNIAFTEEQLNDAMKKMMTEGEVDLSEYDLDTPRLELKTDVYYNKSTLPLNIYQNGISIGSSKYNQGFYETVFVNDNDVFEFRYPSIVATKPINLYLEFKPTGGDGGKYANAVIIEKNVVKIKSTGTTIIKGKINFMKYVYDEEGNQIYEEDGKTPSTEDINAVGCIGELICYVK